MGYASSVPLSYLEVGSNMSEAFNLTTVQSDYNFTNDMDVPDNLNFYPINHAYLDMYVPHEFNNDAGATNYTVGGQYIQISVDAGVSWHNAILIETHSFWNTASGSPRGTIRLLGGIDIASLIRNVVACNIHFRWKDRQANSNSLTFGQIWFVLRMTGV